MKARTTIAFSAAVLLLAAFGATAAFAGCGQDGTCSHHQATATQAKATADDPILTPYLAIQTALAADTLDGVPAAANALATAADAAELTDLADAARAEAGAQDLKAARAAFAPLSDAMIARQGDAAGGPRVAYCPMAKHSWLQTGDAIANPYYGKSMLRCGKFVSE